MKAPAFLGSKWFRRCAVVFVVYSLLGFLAVPAIIKWQLRKQLPGLTQRQTAIRSVRANPWTFSLTIRGLALTEPDAQPFAGWEELYVNFDPVPSLFRWAWSFRQISLKQPACRVAYLGNNQFNFSNLLTNRTAQPASAKPTGLPRVRIGRLAIEQGTFTVEDLSRPEPFRTAFVPINVQLTNFTTRAETDNPYAFIASTAEGESFGWSGDFMVSPPSSSGRFRISGLDFKKYGGYAKDYARFDVLDGKLEVEGEYRFQLAGTLAASLTNAAVRVTQLKLRAPDTGDTIVDVPTFTIAGATASLADHAARIPSIRTSGGQIVARRYANRVLQFLALLKRERAAAGGNSQIKPELPASAPPRAATAARPWQVRIDEVVVENYTVRVDDRTTPIPAALTIGQVGLTARNLSNLSNAPFQLALTARLNQAGTVKINAEATLFPVEAAVDVEVAGLDLRPFQPYVQQYAKVTLSSGLFNTRQRIRLAPSKTGAPLIAVNGDVALTEFAAVDQVAYQDFARWKAFEVTGINAALAPNSVEVDRVFFDSPVLSLVVDTNGQPTCLSVLVSAAAGQPADPEPAPVAGAPGAPATSTVPGAAAGLTARFPMRLGAFAFTNASLRFVDLSIQPHCDFAVRDFSGTVKGLSSELNTVADVDISGRVDEYAPFAVSGRLNPLAADLLVDLVISNRNTELTAFTPYMEKYAGYPLQKGKLTVGLRYAVEKRFVRAENRILVDQLTLGARNDSPDATKLPVKLAVALLKDRNGRIELNIPVSGSLDDPQFRIGPIIWHTVLNLLVKAATSPFSLLGSMFGGGEELSFVDFTAGRSVIPEGEARKLDTLIKALYERPALTLEICGSAEPDLDRAALAWINLEQQLRAVLLSESGGDSNTVAPAELRLEPKEYQRVLRTVYRKTFNRTRTEPPPAIVAPAESAGLTNVPAAPAAGRVSAPAVGGKGSQLLMASRTARRKAPVVNTNTPAATDPAQVTRPENLPPAAPEEETVQMMETELLAGTGITDSDLRDLMQARARAVREYLLKSGQLAEERVFITTPATSESAPRGQSRVNLTLQ